MHVTMVRGRLGEIRVEADGTDLFEGPRLWYPSVKKVVATVRSRLAPRGGSRTE